MSSALAGRADTVSGDKRSLLKQWLESGEALRVFSGNELPARVRCTIVAGQIAFEGWDRA